MRRAAAILALCVLLVPAAARADDGTSPPVGITPAAMRVQRLLQLHDEAVGSVDRTATRTEVRVSTYQDGPLTGTQTFYRSGHNFRRDTALGPFHSAVGEFDGKAWEQNRNGLVHTLSGIHSRDEVNSDALESARTVPTRSVTVLGRVTSPVNAYVVKVDPPGGRIEYLYYDASTFLLVRDEEASEGRRITYTYDDFRITNGVRAAWHIHRTNGIADSDADWKVQSLSYGDPVDDSKLAVPQSAQTVIFNGERVKLPASVSGDRIILSVQIGRHKVNLQMDSGASMILLNRDVGDATGVTSYGTRTEETAGQYLASDALAPKLTIGDAVMQNVAIETAPYVSETYDGSPVAGLIGYDFIAGAVMHVDYQNGVVEAIGPTAFQPPANAIAVPIRLDDGVPVIAATIGNAKGERFIVDTGADRSMIFSGFARAHPADVVDQGLGETLTSAFPYVPQIYGVGGKVQVTPVQVPSLRIASIALPKWLFDVSHDAPSFEGDDYDGLIGQDVLRNFDVYFDYARTTIYFVPNDRFRQRFA